MDTIDKKAELLNRILTADDDMARLRKWHQANVAALGKRCPLQPGDRTEVTDYSHRGEPMEVIGVTLVRSSITPGVGSAAKAASGGYCYEVRGAVLKKDGTPGLNIGYRYEPVIEE